MADEVITEDWLREAGFRWHQFDRQPEKHWLLWLGDAIDPGSADVLGIELAPMGHDDLWYCWLRSDFAGRYHRFLHVRQLEFTDDLIRMIEGLTGQSWTPENNLYGSMRRPNQAARLRHSLGRLDQQLMLNSPKWAEVEKDDSRGRALPEHMEVAEKERERRAKLTREERIAEDQRS